MLTEDGRPVCGSCGATVRVRYQTFPPHREPDGVDDWSLPPWVSRPFTAAEYEQTARASGWRVGELPGGVHDAMCPRCGRPDRALTALCAELAASTQPTLGEQS